MGDEKGYWATAETAGGVRRWRLSRRRVLSGTALSGAGLAAAAVLGCRREERPAAGPEVPAAKQPKRGGTLTRLTSASGSFPEGLDPHKAGGSEAGLMSLFYEGLVRFNRETYEPEPGLAQKWEQRSETEYVFTLAPNIKWHNKPPLNGRELTAEDVAFSINRFRTNDPTFVNRGVIANVDKVEAIDKTTLRITTKTPDVVTLVNLSEATLLTVSREAVERWDRLTAAEHVIGTGPFILQSKDDTGALAVRNPDYWKPGLPYLDAVRLVHIADPQARFAAFLAGQLDVTRVPGVEAKKFEAEHSKSGKYHIGWFRSPTLSMFWPNVERKPFDDVRVTKALRLLIDHKEAVEAWVEVIFGRGTAFTLPHLLQAWDLTPEEYAQTLEWKQPKDDAAKEALALLSAAGFTRDNPLRAELMNNNNIDTGRPTAQLVQSQFRRLSQGVVQIELNLVDNATSRTRQARGEFELSGPVGRGSQFDPDQVFRAVYYTRGNLNFGRYSDPTLDAMIDRQVRIFDIQQRKAAVKEVIRYLIDKAPCTNFADFGDSLNAAQLKVQDWVPEHERVHAYQYERVWLDI